jgi:hypothetical protein
MAGRIFVPLMRWRGGTILHMAKVIGFHIYAGPPLSEPFTAPKNLMLKDDGGLARKFRDALLKSQEAFSIELRILQYSPLHCNFARCGQAAGVAHWWRDNISHAVTAYLPGLDEEDEYTVELALALKPFPISLHHWHELLKAERPIYGNFYLTRESTEDRVLSTAADALAFSFFSVLGIA